MNVGIVILSMDELKLYMALGIVSIGVVSFDTPEIIEDNLREEKDRLIKLKNVKLKMTNKHNNRKNVITYLRDNVLKELLNNRLHPKNISKFEEWGFTEY
jgi:hypothetical protein